MNIYLEGEVYTIVEFQHVKPGKGAAFVRTKLRKLRTGQNIEKTFRAGEKVDPAFVERRKLQYLYKAGDEVVVMDIQDYEQHHYPLSYMGDGAKYLTEGMEVSAMAVDGEVWGLEIPNFVELAVSETDPAFKGDTVSGGSKPATMEGGAIVSVPFHINPGDILKIDTRTDTYLERVKTA
ncbi:MAG: elongation factor P [Armatimonadetes bacterium]|nr:elongation factor P [Armatimonadota bacterium]